MHKLITIVIVLSITRLSRVEALYPPRQVWPYLPSFVW